MYSNNKWLDQKERERGREGQNITYNKNINQPKMTQNQNRYTCCK